MPAGGSATPLKPKGATRTSRRTSSSATTPTVPQPQPDHHVQPSQAVTPSKRQKLNPAIGTPTGRKHGVEGPDLIGQGGLEDANTEKQTHNQLQSEGLPAEPGKEEGNVHKLSKC